MFGSVKKNGHLARQPLRAADPRPSTLVPWDSTAIFQDLLETGDFSLWTEEP
jgi:hypothetical protein